ncbi:MAG: hypothetical protein Unbinned585contig1001_29 [Prokaryotic dsDNA virus sp.]|nr:MAG: hypothetical protein Unbinned585contig1001_29 [Prokaryotic dsDNA virus sp.]|tara:strand:+ start:2104 stop:2589 length:486 start_codon:yes stop_codon:yes gene_type:complete
MFQFEVAGASWDNYFYINLYDKMVKNGNEFTQKPVFAITSQQTGKQKLFFPNTWAMSSHYERYYKFVVKYIKTEVDGVFYPGNGWIALNNKDFPYGFYDLQLYQKKYGFTTLDLDNVEGVIYTGLLNVKPLDASDISVEVQYNQYNDNDSDTDNVYVTATL